MNAIFENATFKLQDHLNKINELFNTHGYDLFNTQDFKARINTETNSLIDVVLFYFVLGYEIQNTEPDTIRDPTNAAGVLNAIIQDLENLMDRLDEDLEMVARLALSFMHQFFVFKDKEEWISYASRFSLSGDKLASEVRDSFEHLRQAIINLSYLKESDNVFFNYLRKYETEDLISTLRMHLVENSNPDIGAAYLFADQLYNVEYWNAAATLMTKWLQMALLRPPVSPMTKIYS